MAEGDLDLIHQADDRIKKHIETFAYQSDDLSIVQRELQELADEYHEFIMSVEDIQKVIGDQLREIQRGNQASSAYCDFMTPSIP